MVRKGGVEGGVSRGLGKLLSTDVDKRAPRRDIVP